MYVLEARDVSIRFGGVRALTDFSLRVGEWEIAGLIGPNGAGKTTAFNCISGFYTPDTGKVLYRGRDVTDLAPHQRAGLGMGRTFQNIGMVKSASAVDNLLTAQHIHAGYGAMEGIVGNAKARRSERDLDDRAREMLRLLGLQEVGNVPVASLPYGKLKLLELGCALSTEPDILLLDEPSSGMGPDEAHELGVRLVALRRAFGLTMLVIEHHVPLVTSICDYVYVLNFGQLLAEGEPSYIQRHPEVVAAYFGGNVEVDEQPASEELTGA